MWKGGAQDLRVLLVHPGGPFWAKKDAGAWSIPKGEYGSGEDALTVARREFEEELGVASQGPVMSLEEARAKINPAQAAFLDRLAFRPDLSN